MLEAVASTNVADPEDVAGTLMPAMLEGKSPGRAGPDPAATRPPRKGEVRARLRHRQLRGGQRDGAAGRAGRGRAAGPEGGGRVVERRGPARRTARARRSRCPPASPVRPPTPRASTSSAAPRRWCTRCGSARAASSTRRSSRPSPRTPTSCWPMRAPGDPRDRVLEVEPEPGRRDRRHRPDGRGGGVRRPGRPQDARGRTATRAAWPSSPRAAARALRLDAQTAVPARGLRAARATSAASRSRTRSGRSPAR